MSLRCLAGLAVILVLAPFSACDCDAEPIVATQPKAEAPELLDFGAVPEGTTIALPIVVENVGQADLEVNAILGEGSQEFAVETASVVIRPRETADINVRFAPVGIGEDVGSVVLSTTDDDRPEIIVQLHGGPIAPVLEAPEVIDFSTAGTTIVQVTLTNNGNAVLHLETIQIDAGGNPQFGTDAPFDQDVVPGGGITFNVEHFRATTRADEGRLLIQSNDPEDGPGFVRAVRLIPDPLGPCEDGQDNDDDGLVDFPQDPGCSEALDDTEENPIECIDGAVVLCGSDVGVCETGTSECVGGQFGACDDATEGNAAEQVCDGLDDDCDGRTDELVTQPCQTAGGCDGVQACIEDGPGVFDACQPLVSSPEQCNTLDDDCDGVPDNMAPQACSGPGGCDGTQLCNPGTGTFTVCECNGVCGDGDVAVNEECDDGNTSAGDGCDDECIDEFCGDSIDNDGANEECDDGNASDFDLCTSFCDNARCGDSFRQLAINEECDDGNGTNADGCDTNCTTSRCGNDVVAGGEECDDGNTQNGDGCSSICTDENPVCDPDGTYNLIGAVTQISYSCCLGLVGQTINAFIIQSDGNNITGSPSGTGTPFGDQAQCPAGTFTRNQVVPGGCTETYEIEGTFTDADTFVGEYRMIFVGEDCDCFGAGACIDQVFQITAQR